VTSSAPDPREPRGERAAAADRSHSDESDALAVAEQLARQVNRGLRWSMGNTLLQRLGSLFSGVLIARLISPDDYGSFAVALVVLTALLSMNELGVSLAIVRWDGDVRRIAPTVATLSLMSSIALYAVAFLAAPAIASALNAHEASAMIRVLALGVIVDGLAAASIQVLTREFAQGRRFAIDTASFLVGTGLSVGLAWAGLGGWALVWGSLVSNVLAGVLAILAAPWRAGWGFDRETARGLLAFGLPLAGSSLLLFIMLNVDYLVVGHLLGPTQLGLYLWAFNLCSWPVNLVSTTIRRVSLAGFSRISGGGQGGPSAYVTSIGATLLLAVPMCTGLAVFAPQIVGILYGPTWAASAAVVRPLALFALARILVELSYDFLVAVDRGRSNLVVQGVWLAALVPAVIVGARAQGIVGVGIAHAVVACAIVLPVLVVLLGRAGVSASLLGRAGAWPLVTAVPMGAAGYAVAAALPAQVPAFLVGGTVSVGVYALCNLRRLRRVRHDLARTVVA
jgi:PST family polysaccharide transporter